MKTQAKLAFEKGKNIKKYTELTPRQKMAINEYIKTGNKSAAIRAVYNVQKKELANKACRFFRKPKIVDALNKALKDANFDDAYGVNSLKKIIDGGLENIDQARPDTAMKGLELFWKLTNKLGGNKEDLKLDIEAQVKKMGMDELQESLKELDKKQQRIMAIIEGKVQEGEIIK